MTNVRIMRVLGIRARTPCVHAIVDDYRVRWDRRGWLCDCPTFATSEETCHHVDTLAALLDPRVTGEDL